MSIPEIKGIDPIVVKSETKNQTAGFNSDNQRLLHLVKKLTVGLKATHELCRKNNEIRFCLQYKALCPGSPLLQANGAPCKGSFGWIQKTRNPDAGFEKVLKVQVPGKKKENKHFLGQAIRQEALIHQTLCNRGVPNIPRFDGLLNSLEDIFVLSMERADRSLKELYASQKDEKDRIMDLNTIELFAKMILKTLYHMQNPPKGELPIAHLDLKPANITFDSSKRRLSLVDFGASKFVPETGARAWHHGTAPYFAPEIALGLKTNLCAADMFSLGCILYELYTGHLLFPLVHKNGIQQTILLLNTYRDRLGEEVPHSLAEKSPIFNRLYTGDPGNKKLIATNGSLDEWNIPMSTAQHKYHPEDSSKRYDDFNDLLKSLLIFDPENRITAAEALEHPFFKGPESTVLSFQLSALKERNKWIRIKDFNGKPLVIVDLSGSKQTSYYYIPKLKQPYFFELLNPSDPGVVIYKTALQIKDGSILNIDSLAIPFEEGKSLT